MRKYFLLAVLLAEVIMFLYLETNNIEIKEITVKDNQLGEVFNAIRIVQISDLHITKTGKREKDLIKKLDEIGPDIVFITGDFITGESGINDCLEVLKEITSKRCVIAVLGNSDHEYRKSQINAQMFKNQLRNAGVILLINESVKLTVIDEETNSLASYFVIGVDDNYLGYDNYEKAAENISVQSPKILLAHTPNIVEEIRADGINLVLCGHTHGGQINLPLFGALYVNRGCRYSKRFVSGLYRNDNTKIYVNRGIGTSVLNLRFFCRPEITVFRFKSDG